MTWDDTLSTLLLGTERRPGPAEAELLRAATVETVRRRAGAVAPTTGFVLEPAHPETAPECSARAAQLLDLALADHLGAGSRGALTALWLDTCAAAGRIVPAEYVPALLDLGRATTSLRPSITFVVGSRGRWLARLAGTWPWIHSGQDDDADVDVIADRLRSARRDDPEEGRDAVVAATDGVAAADRAVFVSTIAVNLSSADEPLLESLLDDRSRTVRAAAIDLLAQLPDSAWSKRMIDRVEPLITNRRRGRFRVDLPDELDDDSERDGIIGKPPPKVGRLAWWLRQIIAGVPLEWWESTLDADPPTLAHHAPVPEVRLGWIDAVQRQRNDRWAAALFDAGPEPALVSLLTEEAAADRLLAAARGRRPFSGVPSLESLARLLAAGPHPWSGDLSLAVAKRLDAANPNTDRGFSQLVALLDRADESATERLAALAEGLPNPWQRLIRTAIGRISFKTTITQEFT